MDGSGALKIGGAVGRIEDAITSNPSAGRLLQSFCREVGPRPYRGLAAFREEDAPFFFGREGFAERLHRAVQERPPVAVIVGSSGSGKSSAVFAGLLPRLRAGGDAGDWLIASFRPGTRPFRALADSLAVLAVEMSLYPATEYDHHRLGPQLIPMGLDAWDGWVTEWEALPPRLASAGRPPPEDILRGVEHKARVMKDIDLRSRLGQAGEPVRVGVLGRRGARECASGDRDESVWLSCCSKSSSPPSWRTRSDCQRRTG